MRHIRDVGGLAVNVPDAKIDADVLVNPRLTWRNADEDLEALLEVPYIFDEYYFLTDVEIAAAAGGASARPGSPPRMGPDRDDGVLSRGSMPAVSLRRRAAQSRSGRRS